MQSNTQCHPTPQECIFPSIFILVLSTFIVIYWQGHQGEQDTLNKTPCSKQEKNYFKLCHGVHTMMGLQIEKWKINQFHIKV